MHKIVFLRQNSNVVFLILHFAFHISLPEGVLFFHFTLLNLRKKSSLLMFFLYYYLNISTWNRFRHTKACFSLPSPFSYRSVLAVKYLIEGTPKQVIILNKKFSLAQQLHQAQGSNLGYGICGTFDGYMKYAVNLL